MNSRELNALWLGQRSYGDVLRLQQDLLLLRKQNQMADTVLLLEHEPTITLGRGARAEHLLVSQQGLEDLGVALHPTDRGGDITLHAPGQLVAYPIIALESEQRDVRRYVRNLAEVMRRVAADFAIDAGTIDEYIGLWADAAAPEHWRGAAFAAAPVKLGAIGVRISRWTTMHGFALNVSTDLAWFRLIVPCGIRQLGVGSVHSLTGKHLAPRDVSPGTHRHLSDVLGFRLGSYLDVEERELDAVVSLATIPSRAFTTAET